MSKKDYRKEDIRKDLKLIYQFWFSVIGATTESGIKNAKPTVALCEDFANEIGAHCMCDHVGAFNKRLQVRVQFHIHGPQDLVFPKVASLFAFAATHKLNFTNQFFLTED